MKKLSIGIIGAGGIATGIHLPALSALPEVDVRAVCDLINERAEGAARTFGIPHTYQSYFNMLREETLDAVFVLVQPDALFRVVSDCLLACKHVFMEKPMGIMLFQAKSLQRLAEAQKRTLHVGFNRRYIPLVMEVTRKMRELTNINHIEGRFYKNSSPSFYNGCAGAFVCDVVHVVDLVRHLAAGSAGGSPKIIRAATLETVSRDTGIAGAWYSSMEFDNGVTGCVRANYGTGGRVHEFELHGPGASAYINLGFGGAACSAKILYDTAQGGFSLSASGVSEPEVLEFDGTTLAGSDRYEVYYGYTAEDRLFIQTVLENPLDMDIARAAEDCATMEAIERLLDARVTGGNLC